MNYLDIAIGVLIVFGIFRGLYKGLFVEVASLVALVLGIYCAMHFSYEVGSYMEKHVDWEPRYVNLIAFILVFCVVIILVSLAGKMLTKMADFAALGLLNRMLGGLFGGLKVAVILGALLVFFEATDNVMSFVDAQKKRTSLLYEPVKNLGETVFFFVLRKSEEELPDRYDSTEITL
ncbi:membrane protein required for colicin V production [Sinomicrobium oceani]|uniref:Membrane protein required for colicin V production n=1 Tax=Sinomicrobium oceani TaxID=1150368 RepID=A0A1K1P902_9FLAO|nr:CvpA family protein [Sinomicrobium oceani]SFW43166.1 membrane protein required for colicin V production [Sinomicrobium oceani]